MNYGTDPENLHRFDSSDTSREAAHSVDTTKLERMVHDAIKAHGADGCIQDDILARFPDHPYSSITARFRALIDKGLIHRPGMRRKGLSGRSQAVMIDGPDPRDKLKQ